ncbi:MAG: DsbC family protein [Woeseiaceae bacterium]|nr:DsbC family protein [Woeseiaceae bacterium]
MKLLPTFFACALLLAASVTVAQDQDADLAAVRAVVAEKFDEIAPEHVFASPIDGWYTIRRGAIVAYISADGRYLLQGDLIDLDRQVNLSEEARDEARREMMAAVPDDETIVFAPDEVRHTVSVFTDVDCTYCRRLHSQIDQYLAKGIEVRYLLYPRNGPTSPSWATAERVWCAKDRNKALTLAKLDQEFESQSCGTAMVSEHYAMGQDVGLRGTPAIVLEDGTLVSGYLPPDRLAEALDAAPAPSP